MAHIRTFGSTYVNRFFDCLEPKRFSLYGSPSEEVKQALSQGPMITMRQRAGFNRLPA